MKTASLILSLCLLFAGPRFVQAQGAPQPDREVLQSRRASLAKQLELLELQREELLLELRNIDPAARVEVLRREISVMEIEKQMSAVGDELTRVTHELSIGQKPAAGESERREATARLEHMLAAHEHLQAAGLQEIAMQVADRAERLQRRLQSTAEPKRRPQATAGSSDEEFRDRVSAAIRELNAAVQQLREEVRRLRNEINRDD